MKVNTLSRVESRYKKERAGGLDRVMRNPDPELHPLEKAREVRSPTAFRCRNCPHGATNPRPRPRYAVHTRA